jgi:polyhydroxybutyrate depolymerase
MKKIIGIFIVTLLISNMVLSVSGRILLFEENYLNEKSEKLLSDNTELKWMIAGEDLRCLRSYWLHVPPSYDGSEEVALVVALHGSTGFSLRYPFWFFRSSFMESYTEFSKKSDDKGFIVVYPNAKLDFYTHGFDYNYGYVPGGVPKFVDDVGYIQDLIDKMNQMYKINSNKIYITGLSDGAAMTYSIGAYLSDTVAAIAPVAGIIGGCFSLDNNDYYQIPAPTKPVSVIIFHGTNDSLVAYGGGGDYNMSSVNESVIFWVEHNGCNPVPEINISESGKIIQRTYTNGENGAEVILYTTVGGEHWWPGNPLNSSGAPWLVDTIQEISATDLVWDFFESHPKQ